MSIATASAAAPAVDVTADERTERLEQAEQAWGERLAADAANGRWPSPPPASPRSSERHHCPAALGMVCCQRAAHRRRVTRGVRDG
ncbi:hypothetical protein SAMN04487783_0713 [Agrococcus baldri]|uniref:Uncharacterized protein n=1 Tax=Agrococcus baldri TaxID=153730 RepID=A0AA94HL51_9MICO|nr:hypothetical protein [Agrococcus baldri]SFS03090.1 hypothetical protein SAMN04487783_0713 [Agrococcus baldri]